MTWQRKRLEAPGTRVYPGLLAGLGRWEANASTYGDADPDGPRTLLAAVSGVARVRGVDGADYPAHRASFRLWIFRGLERSAECLSAPAGGSFSVSGRIIAPQDLSVPSNTTIDARGSGVQPWGGGLILRRVEDVIVAGLSITEGDGDAVRVHNRSAGIWLGWLDLSHCDDGLLDVTGASTDVTLAHSVLHDHAKGMLFGASPNDSGDSVMRVTVHDTIIATTYRHLNAGMVGYTLTALLLALGRAGGGRQL